jgi:hypothetical protein
MSERNTPSVASRHLPRKTGEEKCKAGAKMKSGLGDSATSATNTCENARDALQGRCGRLAQLEEHLVYTERVGGSSPSAPTIQVVL